MRFSGSPATVQSNSTKLRAGSEPPRNFINDTDRNLTEIDANKAKPGDQRTDFRLRSAAHAGCLPGQDRPIPCPDRRDGQFLR